MTKQKSIELKWHEQSEATKQQADKLPYGNKKNHLLRKARQLETASQIGKWLSSPGLQPPT
jgi:hypothetical protein